MKDNCSCLRAEVVYCTFSDLASGRVQFWHTICHFPLNAKETVIANLKLNALNVAEPQHPFHLLSASEVKDASMKH